MFKTSGTVPAPPRPSAGHGSPEPGLEPRCLQPPTARALFPSVSLGFSEAVPAFVGFLKFFLTLLWPLSPELLSSY